MENLSAVRLLDGAPSCDVSTYYGFMMFYDDYPKYRHTLIWSPTPVRVPGFGSMGCLLFHVGSPRHGSPIIVGLRILGCALVRTLSTEVGRFPFALASPVTAQDMPSLPNTRKHSMEEVEDAEG